MIKTTPLIVENEAAATATLFQPINGRTADGYVVKRSANYVDVHLLGRVYRVNRFLVWCKSSVVNGVTHWQHAVLDFPWGYMAMDDAAQALAVSRSWVGREMVASFK